MELLQGNQAKTVCFHTEESSPWKVQVIEYRSYYSLCPISHIVMNIKKDMQL